MRLVGLLRGRPVRDVVVWCVLGAAAGYGAVAGGGGRDDEPVSGSGIAAPAAGAALGPARGQEGASARRAAVARRWGLAAPPLRAPKPPSEKPDLVPARRAGGRELPAVVSRVPTDQRVVFLTIDDGDDKDPEFVRMMRELDVPYSAFLSHYLAKEDYGYFRGMQKLGTGLHNHTLNHPFLPGLDAAGQRKEICGQQRNLRRETGRRPRLFRPPYGEYTAQTLRIARSCGIRVVPLWTQEVFPDRMDHGGADRRLHPGDIILTHFRGRGDWPGSMPDVARRVLRTATEQGFALARLEDYV
ncbi:polysaccharide deacetylase family protein [Streptomyces sp. Pv4-95]|uniref:polysaccharide deacetylase family protein n=1 Tax=Streptomyces sp. Pv4-95 TaxID=3049543 RepID=UPI00389293A8